MKDIYEALNYAEINLEEYEDKQLDDIEVKRIENRLKGKLKNKKRNRRFGDFGKRVAIIVGTLTLALAITYKSNPTFATNLPLVGGLIKNIIGEGNTEYDKYTQVLDKTIEKNGFRVTLKEFNIDSIGARIATTFETDEILEKEKVLTMNPKLYINGKWINCSGSGSKDVVDEHKYLTIDVLNISKASVDIPENMEVKLEYEEIMVDNKPIKGPWVFKFKASKKEVMSESKTYKLKDKFKLKDGSTVSIEELTITPVAMSLKYKCNSNIIDFLSAKIIDNNGVEIIATGGNAGGNTKGITGEELFNPPKKDVTKLSIEVKAKIHGEKDEVVGEYNFEIDLKK